jgi:ribosomal protein S18 acetylase RimI-like enzyme
MAVEFREMTISDYEEVFDLWQHTENIGLSSADTLENLEIYLCRNPGMSFVARDSDALVGAVLCGHDGRRATIYHLAVQETARGRGIGSQLVRQCIVALKTAGIERCHIHVYAANQNGLAFWQKEGWFLRPELNLLSYNI